MATARITIDSFSKGIVNDITRNTGMASIFACDIFIKPGRIRASERLIEDNDNNITTDGVLLTSITPYRYGGVPITVELFGFGAGELYYRLDATSAWTHLHTIAPFGGRDSDIVAFGDSLYYSAHTRLGQLQGDPTVGGNYTDNYRVLTSGTGTGIMEVFASSLYIAKGRYIDKLEADEFNFTQSVLVLPEGTNISCMIRWNDRLVIGTSNTLNEKPGTVYIWDGTSEFPEQAIDLPVSGIQAIFNFNNRLYVVIQGRFYRYTGSEFEIEFTLPNLGDDSTFDAIQIGRNSLILYKERMLIAAANESPNATDFKGGVYAYGRRTTKDNYALTLEHEFSTKLPINQATVGAMYTGYDPLFTSDIFVVAYRDFELFEAHVDILNTADVYPNSAYFVTPAYEIATDFGRLIKGAKLFFNDNILDTDTARHNVVVKYRVDGDIDYDDDSVNWTTLGTIDYDNKDVILYGVYERPNRIQWRFDITDNSITTGKYVEIAKIEIF